MGTTVVIVLLPLIIVSVLDTIVVFGESVVVVVTAWLEGPTVTVLVDGGQGPTVAVVSTTLD